MMLPVIVSDIVTDLLHELCALAAHIQYLISCSIGSGLLTIAIIHRKSENAIGYKAVSEPGSYVDGSNRQHKETRPRSRCSSASNSCLYYLRLDKSILSIRPQRRRQKALHS